MLEARIAAARIHVPSAGDLGATEDPVRMASSSHGGLTVAMMIGRREKVRKTV